MESTIIELDSKRIKLKDKIKTFYNNVFSSNKNTILYVGALLSIIMAIYFVCIYCFCDNFYNNWSDDSLQYYPFMCDFIDGIKHGEISWYSYKNYLGASFFSDTYYIPLDPFTLIIFLLSFLMNTEVAMSVVEIIKFISGSMAIMYYLSLRGVKPKVLHIIGFLYFSSSGITCFSCFPCFTSLAFYIPFSLVITYYFTKGKWYYLPIYSFVLVFYNFYLAYTVFAFMAFSCLVMLIVDKEKILKGCLKLLMYVSLVVLGLVMSMVIFLPSIKFVLSSTSRDVASGGSVKGLLYMAIEYVEMLLTFICDSLKFVKNIFVSKGGLFDNRYLFTNSFIQTRYLFNTIQGEHVFKGVNVMNAFFETEEYYRMLADTMTPLTASSFYGYQSSYFLEHFSFYITGFGLLISMYLWTMKGRKYLVYKIMLVAIVVMMLLPFFSYIFSANLEVLYTRWFNIVTIPLLIIDAYIINEKGLFGLKPKALIIAAVIFAFMGYLSSYHHLETLSSLGRSEGWDKQVLLFENSLFYLVILISLIVGILLVSLYYIGNVSSRKIRHILYPAVSSVLGLSIVLIGVIILVKFLNIPIELFETSADSDNFYSIDDQMAYQYLTFLTIVLVFVAAFALIKKNKIMIGIVIGIEFVFSACMSFGSSVIIQGKETTFENTHNISDFLRENISDISTYRIYVDPSLGDFLDTNTARLMPTGVNSEIFHSFIYSGTDNVAGLIYDKKDEGQAGKRALNTYSYFLNVFLGYKYVVASTSSSFANYDENQFKLINSTEDYILLEFKDYEEFLVYDSFSSLSDFDKHKSSLKNVSRTKHMIDSVVIDDVYLDKLVNKYNLSQDNMSLVEDITKSATYNQRRTFSPENQSSVQIDGKWYKRYEFSGRDSITTRSYAVNLFSVSNVDELVSNNRIFLEFENYEIDEHIGFTNMYDGRYRYVDLNNENIRNMNGSDMHIPIYGDSDKTIRTIKYLYVYLGDDMNKPISVSYTMEAIIPENSELYAYEHGLIDGCSLLAAIKINVGGEINDGTVNLNLLRSSSSSKELDYSDIYIEYEDGEFVSSSKEISVKKPIENIYIVKSDDISALTNPPCIKALTYETNNPYIDSKEEKKVTTKGSKINISYKNSTTSSGYEIIMIPTAYSDEWKIVSGNVEEIIPVNGGFIGLVVSKEIEANSITIKFVPNGLNDGLKYSILGFSLFFSAFIPYMYNVKRKEAILCQL